MKKAAALKDYLLGTDRPPVRGEAETHSGLEHRHWDRGTRSWVEHGAADGGAEAAA